MPVAGHKRVGDDLYATPSRRARLKGSVSSKIKKALDPVLCTAEPQCLITLNRYPRRALQVAHVLDRSTKPVIVGATQCYDIPR